MKKLFSTLSLALLCCVLPLDGKAAEKQYEFNDDNYQPRGADNLIPGVRPRAGQSTRQSGKARQKSAPVQTVKWQWEGSGFSAKNKQKNTTSGTFSYRITEQGIQTNSICNNYKPGSLVYRDCRKAAKRHFGRACSSRFPQACVAAGMAP